MSGNDTEKVVDKPNKKNPDEKIKITLKTGKVVTMRELTVEIDQQCAIDAGAKCDPNNALGSIKVLVMEQARALIVAIDGKVLTGLQKETLGSVFSNKEYQQLSKVILEMSGNDEAPKVEFI